MKRLYVLISDKLNPIYGCVQGGHAVAQWMLDNKDNQTWNNNYLIYLYADIEKWSYKLKMKNLNFSTFNEPDLDNIQTAIAIETDGSLFKNLKMVS